MKDPLVSIIIPLSEINDYLRKETIPKILRQRYPRWEIVVLPDRDSKERLPGTRIVPSWPKTGPADKRDLGVKEARGEILAFLDDDSYPEQNWLKNAVKIFGESKSIAGVCGPSLTPNKDNLRQKASGYVWSTWLGSGGAGTYRCLPSYRREVDDFPTVNLLVKKIYFEQVGGFDSHFWPGEDTKFCLDLVYKLGKKIIYDPNILVYHHRREVFIPHLKQIGRYAVHRGHFARIFPRTSFRLGYILPTLFTLGLVLGGSLSFLFPTVRRIYLLMVSVYLLVLFFTGVGVYFKEKRFKLAVLVMTAILITHLVYGTLFIKGFFTRKLER